MSYTQLQKLLLQSLKLLLQLRLQKSLLLKLLRKKLLLLLLLRNLRKKRNFPAFSC